MTNIRLIASNPFNVIAANNKYDQEYVKYFTGLDVLLLPSYCGYPKVTYSPSRPQILVGPSRDLNAHLYTILKSKAGAIGIPVAAIRELYSKYEYADLAAHPAMVYFPYQVQYFSLLFLFGIKFFSFL